MQLHVPLLQTRSRTPAPDHDVLTFANAEALSFAIEVVSLELEIVTPRESGEST